MPRRKFTAEKVYWVYFSFNFFLVKLPTPLSKFWITGSKQEQQLQICIFWTSRAQLALYNLNSSTTAVHRHSFSLIQVLLSCFHQHSKSATRNATFLDSTHKLQEFIEFNLSIFVQVNFI